jgi:hypothetical protein
VASEGGQRRGPHRRTVDPQREEEDDGPPLTSGSPLSVLYRNGIQAKPLVVGCWASAHWPIFSFFTATFIFPLFCFHIWILILICILFCRFWICDSFQNPPSILYRVIWCTNIMFRCICTWYN